MDSNHKQPSAPFVLERQAKKYCVIRSGCGNRERESCTTSSIILIKFDFFDIAFRYAVRVEVTIIIK